MTDRRQPVDLEFDRLPPHSHEAEQGVLGCLLLDPDQTIDECIERVQPLAFYDLKHRALYQVLCDLRDGLHPIDLITVQQRLKDDGQLDAVGGVAYLSSLQDGVPSAANLGYYIDILLEKYRMRAMVRILTESLGNIYEMTQAPDDILDRIERDVLAVRQTGASSTVTSMNTLVTAALHNIEEAHANPDAAQGIMSGFHDLDFYTRGFKNGAMYVIAGRPSMGKSAIAMNIADHISISQELPVGVFSLEMTAESLVERMLFSRARVRCQMERQEDMFSDGDFTRLTLAANTLASAQLFIDESSELSVMQLRARARRMHQQYGLRFIIVDYMQLVHCRGRRSEERREQEVADVSSGLKAMARELDIPVLILSQLNRETEKSKKPRLSNLRESGAIEQDADFVGLIYRPEANDVEDEPVTMRAAEPVNLIIAKQRNGPTGEVRFTFMRDFTRFESSARVT